MPDGLAFASQNSLGLIQGTPTKPAVTAYGSGNRQLFATVSNLSDIHAKYNKQFGSPSVHIARRRPEYPLHRYIKLREGLALSVCSWAKFLHTVRSYYWTQQRQGLRNTHCSDGTILWRVVCDDHRF